jgi:hypothetical protein
VLSASAIGTKEVLSPHARKTIPNGRAGHEKPSSLLSSGERIEGPAACTLTGGYATGPLGNPQADPCVSHGAFGFGLEHHGSRARVLSASTIGTGKVLSPQR